MSSIAKNFAINSYLKEKDKGKPGYGECLACGKLVHWSREKVTSHKSAKSKNCTGITDEEQNLFRGLKNIKIVEVRTIATDPKQGLPSPQSSLQKPESNLLRVDKLTLEEKSRCDAAIASFFHKTSIPLQIADSDAFKEMISTLRPAYGKLSPSAKVIGGSMLDKQYELMKTEIEAKIKKAKTYSLVTDGWSNARNEHIINFVVCIPDEAPIFYKVNYIDIFFPKIFFSFFFIFFYSKFFFGFICLSKFCLQNFLFA